MNFTDRSHVRKQSFSFPAAALSPIMAQVLHCFSGKHEIRSSREMHSGSGVGQEIEYMIYRQMFLSRRAAEIAYIQTLIPLTRISHKVTAAAYMCMSAANPIYAKHKSGAPIRLLNVLKDLKRSNRGLLRNAG